MKAFYGVYPGAGTSALYIGLGFIPDEVEIFNIDQAEGEILRWNRTLLRSTAGYEGRVQTAMAGDESLLTIGAGVIPYYGESQIATASANYIVPASSVAAYAGDMRDKYSAGSPVTAWTLDTSANRTGHFDKEVSTTYVGVGSAVWIKPANGIQAKRYVVLGLSSNGEQSNEVTLNAAAPTGTVEKIEYFSDFVQAPVGTVMPQGIVINDTTYVNVSGQEFGIKAVQYDGKF